MYNFFFLDFSSVLSPKICAQKTLNSKMVSGGWNSEKEGKATFTKMASHKMHLQKGPSSIKQVITSSCSFFFINLLSSFFIGQIHPYGLNILYGRNGSMINAILTYCVASPKMHLK